MLTHTNTWLNLWGPYAEEMSFMKRQLLLYDSTYETLRVIEITETEGGMVVAMGEDGKLLFKGS